MSGENLLKLPDNVGYIDAATTDPCTNAIHNLTIGKVSGDVVCVFGAGPIGFRVQCAKAWC